MLHLAPVGIAKTVRSRSGASSSTTSTTTVVDKKCTYRYAAPEFHKRSPPGSRSEHALSGDVWGFGITALECLRVRCLEGSLKSVWGEWNDIRLRSEMDALANQKISLMTCSAASGVTSGETAAIAINAYVAEAFKNVRGSPDIKCRIQQQLGCCLVIPIDVSC